MRLFHTFESRDFRAGVLSALLLIVASGVAQAAGGEAYGRSLADLEMESFLFHAQIIDIESVGEGITQPKRLTLEHDGVRHRAIFKNIDAETVGFSYADRLERNFSDKYAYEVAAYRLDRLAGIGLVPVTIVRTVNGEQGSVQLWIENVTTLQEAMEDPKTKVMNSDLLVERLALMYVLDTLIYNVDRNLGNVLVDLERDIFYPIDHSRSFRMSPKPPKSNQGDELLLPDHVIQRLRAIDIETLRTMVGDLLDEGQVRAVIKRRDRLVKMLDKQSA